MKTSRQKEAMKNLKRDFPSVALEWHATKNGKNKPEDFAASSKHKAWWQCPKHKRHVYPASIGNRTGNGSGCPFCSGKKVLREESLLALYPLVALEWHADNNCLPSEVAPRSNKKVYWKCNKANDHVWPAAISDRTRGTGCPFCSFRKVTKSNCLSTTHPELAKQWADAENEDLRPDDVTQVSTKKVFWKCSKNARHIWPAKVRDRVAGSGCTYCAGKRVLKEESLANEFPEIAKEWHPSKNGPKKPEEFSPKSNKKVWWKCPKGVDHEWQTSIDNRTINKSGCPSCQRKKACRDYNLSTQMPALAKEWHPTKNGDVIPSDVLPNAHEKYWWQCSSNPDHAWEASPNNRRKTGCPDCYIGPQSRVEIAISFELQTIFKSIVAEPFTTATKKKWTIDIFIPEVNLGIEYDGAYWHSGSEPRDRQKSQHIRDHGIKLIRLREAPLQALHADDLVFSTPTSIKKITDLVLSWIQDRFKLDLEVQEAIDQYLELEEPQNVEKCDEFVNRLKRERG